MVTVNHQKVSLLNTRLTEIGRSVATKSHTLALIGLGSAGHECDRMDAFSDLDFFLIVEQGHKQSFLLDLSWLTNIYPVDFSFKNTADGYKLLFADDVFCEFAVFEPIEVNQADYAVGKIIWSKNKEATVLAYPSKPIPKLNTNVEFILGELLTNIYVGLGRYLRGEHASAAFFIKHYAVNRLIELIRATVEPKTNALIDPWSVERRIEQHYPQYAALLSQCIEGDTIESSHCMLDHLKVYYRPNAAIVKRIENYLSQIQPS